MSVTCNYKGGGRYVEPNGYIRFYDHSYQTHRVSGPAMIWSDGAIIYSFNGETHREDGMACISTIGVPPGYYIHGKFVSPEEFFLKYGVL